MNLPTCTCAYKCIYTQARLNILLSMSQQDLEVILFSWWENTHVGTLLAHMGILT